MSLTKSRHVVALVSGLGWHVQDLARAAVRVGLKFEALQFDTLQCRVGEGAIKVNAGGVDLTSVDGLLIRMMPPGTLEQVVYRMDVLQRLERRGVRVINSPRAIECAVDKFLSLAKLSVEGLP